MYQDILAKCFVTISEVDYCLEQWARAVYNTDDEIGYQLYQWEQLRDNFSSVS